MFDCMLISLDENYRLLVAEKALPENLRGLLRPGEPINLPDSHELYPYQGFLEFHRERFFHKANSG